jgi:hypothetical protein
MKISIANGSDIKKEVENKHGHRKKRYLQLCKKISLTLMVTESNTQKQMQDICIDTNA